MSWSTKKRSATLYFCLYLIEWTICGSVAKAYSVASGLISMLEVVGLSATPIRPPPPASVSFWCARDLRLVDLALAAGMARSSRGRPYRQHRHRSGVAAGSCAVPRGPGRFAGQGGIAISRWSGAPPRPGDSGPLHVPFSSSAAPSI